MATTDLMIGIGAEYKGKAAFGKANKDVVGLGKGVKTLAKAYIGLAGVQKAFRYGQQALKAFAEDDLAAKKLSKTVGNLGLAYEQTNVANFIAGLEKTFHIADDVLRPAFGKLISTTESYTKSQQLMRIALDASIGSGESLDTVVNDLTQAYVGNTKGLTKYKLGLTKAELAAKSFDEIQQLIAKRFAGQASQAVDTYAFKLNALTIASGNAKEIIGEGLTNAITQAFGSGDINKATTNMEKLAGIVSDVIEGLGIMTGAVVNFKIKSEPLNSNDFMGATPRRSAPFDPMSMKVQDLTPEYMKLVAQRKKDDAAAAKRQRELAAFTKAAAKAEKERLALAKAKSVLDKSSAVMNMDLIQNTAALMGNITADETLRLKLQQAILLGNSTEAGNLAQQLLASQIAALKLSTSNPLSGFTGAIGDALKGINDLRTALSLLGSDKVKIPASVIAGAETPGTGSPSISSIIPINGGYNRYDSSLTPTEIRIFMDPLAAANGVTTTVIDNAANGNSNNYSIERSFAGR